MSDVRVIQSAAEVFELLGDDWGRAYLELCERNAPTIHIYPSDLLANPTIRATVTVPYPILSGWDGEDDDSPPTQPMAVAPPYQPAQAKPPTCLRCNRLAVPAVVVKGKWACTRCGIYVRADGREDTGT